jgi:hypothetical protein
MCLLHQFDENQEPRFLTFVLRLWFRWLNPPFSVHAKEAYAVAQFRESSELPVWLPVRNVASVRSLVPASENETVSVRRDDGANVLQRIAYQRSEKAVVPAPVIPSAETVHDEWDGAMFKIVICFGLACSPVQTGIGEANGISGFQAVRST